jgi:hypothetical protein
MLFPLLRQSAGVMEWWSNGVMKGVVQFEIRALAFANTPLLQYAETARHVCEQRQWTLTKPKGPGFRDLK